jgi:predicted SAM-dependent methyltransferase
MKINIGGANIEGWIQTTYNEKFGVISDLAKNPIEKESVDFIYSSVSLEHLVPAKAKDFLAVCYDVLKIVGSIRIVSLDLDSLVNLYKGNWKNQQWLKSGQYSKVDSRCKMLNTVMRDWGHKYIYNFEDLSALMEEVGFIDIEKKDFGKSDIDELKKIDKKKDSKLIVEGTKL